MARRIDAKLLFHRAASQRAEDARYLFSGGRTTAAVYLAGYGVECLLKALILSQVGKQKQEGILKQFRTIKAHDFEWLRQMYYKQGGAGFPRDVVEAFSIVSGWSTDMRYQPGTVPDDDAEAFLEAADVISKWSNRRL
ncbi:MAG TPA: HEPN domain-containing protein [Urbifossiella sp.]|nr:HEPN domain-containing protein [Urbifossiella sp.]